MLDRFIDGHQENSINPRPILEDITVIIPTLGRDLLENCLESILLGSVWPSNLVVVDQSSSRKVASMVLTLRSLGMLAEHLPSDQKGVAAARNRGIERARTGFIAITDDDCIVNQDWLQSMRFCLQQNPESIITGCVEPGGDGVTDFKNSREIQIYTHPQLKEDVLYPGNMGCSKKLFSIVGFFDESEFLRSAEDNDWSYRALNAGVPIIYSPGVVVTHLDWRNHSQTAATYRAYARSQGGFYGKHLRRRDWFMILRVVIGLARGLRRWAHGIVSGDANLTANGWAVLTQLVPGIIAGIKNRP